MQRRASMPDLAGTPALPQLPPYPSPGEVLHLAQVWEGHVTQPDLRLQTAMATVATGGIL